MATGGGNKAIVAALLANLGIAIAKFVGFLLTRASSMLAESVHSLADSGNQALLLFGGSRARKQATEVHPFGFGRARYLWSFIVAIVLFALGSLFSIYEAVHKLAHPEPIESVTIAVVILAVAIVLESFSMRTAIVESNHVRGNRSWWQFIRHAKTPELPVVLLEDLGALVGLILALVGVVLAASTGDPSWDAYGTMSIGILLGVIAIILAIEMQSLLLGEAATPDDVQRIRGAIESQDGVRRLIDLKTQHLGPEELLVAAKVELESTLQFRDVVRVIDAAEAAVRGAVPMATAMYLEPDYPTPGIPDALQSTEA